MSGLNPEVAIVMGSDSDWPIMEAAALTLSDFKIAYEVELLSAHRMPEEMTLSAGIASGACNTFFGRSGSSPAPLCFSPSWFQRCL